MPTARPAENGRDGVHRAPGEHRQPIRYSPNAAGATALGHSTLASFTRQDARKEIQPKAASTSGTRSTPGAS